VFLAPRQLPPLDAILHDIGQPSAGVIARALGVSERTVYGWQAAGLTPRPAHLALFWETSWGRSQIEAQAVNGERWARGLAQSLQRENATLQARVAYLERVGDFGAANAPTLAPSIAVAPARVEGVQQIGAKPPRHPVPPAGPGLNVAL